MGSSTFVNRYYKNDMYLVNKESVTDFVKKRSANPNAYICTRTYLLHTYVKACYTFSKYVELMT